MNGSNCQVTATPQGRYELTYQDKPLVIHTQPMKALFGGISCYDKGSKPSYSISWDLSDSYLKDILNAIDALVEAATPNGRMNRSVKPSNSPAYNPRFRTKIKGPPYRFEAALNGVSMDSDTVVQGNYTLDIVPFVYYFNGMRGVSWSLRDIHFIQQ